MSVRNTLWDAGHGGNDSGAVNGITGDMEKTVVLAVALKCHEYSLRAGIPSYLVRDGDWFVSLSDRVKLANDLDADLCSIHCNAANKVAEGNECFTSIGRTDSDSWATLSLEEFNDTFPNRKGRYDFSDGDPDKEARFTVLTKTRNKAILYELGFIDSKEVEFLTNPANIAKMAQALVNARLKDLGLPTKLFTLPEPKPEPTLTEVKTSPNTLKERLDSIQWQIDSLRKEYNL